MSGFAVGSLVRARERDWVVLPESDDDFLVLQPVTGADREVSGVLTGLEDVVPAGFPLPDLDRCGDIDDWRLLRDAVRFGFRSSVGPFRCLARVAVAPRAYQLVPLMMALRLRTARLLIADDVGIGKTIEALLIARELIDQGDVKRMAVLCSPALAEQWQKEMRHKFHIEAEVVLPSTAPNLERRCAFGQSLFERFPFTVVSTDFIKSDRRREEFLQQAPGLVIVDEAHTCAGSGRGATQRYELVKGLAGDPDRHMLFLTATPHSGKKGSFRNLVALLDEEFEDIPDDLSGTENQATRRRLARHFVQRRRVDIESYVGEETPFPRRLITEDTYKLTPEYRAFLNRVIRYARETVLDDDGKRRRRIRWWSVLALLRSLASSPEAAEATLRNRSATLEATTSEEADEVGRSTVLDLADDDSLEGVDVVAGSDVSELDDDASRTRRRLRDLARDAAKLKGPEHDAKLARATAIIRSLTAEGNNPIIFCRFIPTAEYLGEQLRAALKRKAHVEVVTGALPHEEREARVAELGARPEPRVLVATDCLSEGVNLQEHFDAVFHYDLSWNPTRHEQREGRVDRYGQPRGEVRAVTFYGEDNGIDGIVLEVLIRKHEAIRSQTGVSVPVPGDSDSLVEALMERVILRTGVPAEQLTLEGVDAATTRDFELEWEDAAEREKKARHLFAQHAIKADEVMAEVNKVRHELGDTEDLADFVASAVELLGGRVTREEGALRVELEGDTADLAATVPHGRRSFVARTSYPVTDAELYLTRTHPLVEALAARVLDAAVHPSPNCSVARCGSSRTLSVADPTLVFLVRHRVLLTTIERGGRHAALAEQCEFLAVDHLAEEPEWMDGDEVELFLDSGRLLPLDRREGSEVLGEVFENFDNVRDRLYERAEAVAAFLHADHVRVRDASRRTGIRFEARPASPPDVLGVYALLPGVGA